MMFVSQAATDANGTGPVCLNPRCPEPAPHLIFEKHPLLTLTQICRKPTKSAPHMDEQDQDHPVADSGSVGLVPPPSSGRLEAGGLGTTL